MSSNYLKVLWQTVIELKPPPSILQVGASKGPDQVQSVLQERRHRGARGAAAPRPPPCHPPVSPSTRSSLPKHHNRHLQPQFQYKLSRDLIPSPAARAVASGMNPGRSGTSFTAAQGPPAPQVGEPAAVGQAWGFPSVQRRITVEALTLPHQLCKQCISRSVAQAPSHCSILIF